MKTKLFFIIPLLLTVSMIFEKVKAQNLSYIFAAAQPWVAPCGVTLIQVQCWGGWCKKTKELKPEEEILGLNTLLELVLQEEKYEIAAIIKKRLDRIELERTSNR